MLTKYRILEVGEKIEAGDKTISKHLMITDAEIDKAPVTQLEGFPIKTTDSNYYCRLAVVINKLKAASSLSNLQDRWKPRPKWEPPPKRNEIKAQMCNAS